MAEIIKESETVYRKNIWPVGKQWHEGIQVLVHEDEETLHPYGSMSEAEAATYADFQNNPSAYETSVYRAFNTGATVRCQCGAAHQLDGRGDSDCEACGQPYNTFGQELRRGCYRFTGREGDDDNDDSRDDDDERGYYDSDDDY